MKPRWTILFWCTLASLVGTSWMASRFGVSMSVFLNVQWGGLLAAAVVAFVAMIRVSEAKWPAALILLLVAPIGLEVLRALPDLGVVIDFIGVPGVVMLVGVIATAVAAVWILVAAVPSPPPPPPVPEARVVD